jgi:hypothetical protein
VSSPHDALFKHVFSQPEHAASELRAVLPAGLSARLDWSSLELEPSSFVDEHLRGRQADLLFRVGCAGRSAFLYILFEHQSTTDALMAFRLLRYMTRIWDASCSRITKQSACPPSPRSCSTTVTADGAGGLNSARCSMSTRRPWRSWRSTSRGFDSCSPTCRALAITLCVDAP